MVELFKRFRIFFLVMAVISIVVLYIMYNHFKTEPTLPIYQPSMVNSELVDEDIQHVRKFHTIADFQLINQYGDTITQRDYQDKIYIADFFFTTCPTICPIMTDNMVKLQQRLKGLKDIMFLSHSVTPEIDSAPVLKIYADAKGVDGSNWNLVTGDLEQIYSLARKSYLVAQLAPGEDPYEMVHTENFVLVDKKRRIRGYYDGTDWEDMERLLVEVDILLAEKE